jgi:hypothetical protein
MAATVQPVAQLDPYLARHPLANLSRLDFGRRQREAEVASLHTTPIGS